MRARTRPRAPAGLLVPAVLAVALLVLPFVALVVRAPWGRMATTIASGPVVEALWLSLRCATAATAICLVLGVPLAWVLARSEGWLARVVRALVTVPLVLPPVVGGVALLMLLGRVGLLGEPLDRWTGVTLPFTTPAVVVAETFVALPFLVIAVEGTLRGLDGRTEAAATTFGASPWYVLRRVTLPRALPGIVSGAVLAFARALGEFGATITFAGNFPGTTRTMPLAIYLTMETDPDAAVALSLVLVAVSLAVLLALRGRWLTGVRA